MSRDYFSIELQRDELNRYFGGGLPKNSLILLEGSDGSGKSVVCQRFIYAMLKKEVKISYISTELNMLDFIRQMESLNYSVREFILNRNMLFISMIPFLGTVKYSDDFIDKIIKQKELFANDVIIFDTLSFLMMKKDANDEDLHKVITFFKKLNNLNKMIIITVDPIHLNEKFMALLRNVTDMYVSMEANSFAGEIVRSINIKRFKRPCDVFVSKIPFRVEPKEGLIIEIGSFA